MTTPLEQALLDVVRATRELRRTTAEYDRLRRLIDVTQQRMHADGAGRPRIHTNNAARQKAYRDRKRARAKNPVG